MRQLRPLVGFLTFLTPVLAAAGGSEYQGTVIGVLDALSATLLFTIEGSALAAYDQLAGVHISPRKRNPHPCREYLKE